jgi:hypothetical protein
MRSSPSTARPREETAKKRDELRKKTEEKIAAALEKGQKQRLDEIALQQQGVDALVSAPVVAALKLSEEQVGKIKAAMTARDEEVRKAMEAARQGGGGDRAAIREKTQAARKSAEEKATAVLSGEQREAFTKLKGKPFELDRGALRQGGGRREGQGGQRQRRPQGDV